jgi:hypothetical protein
MLAHPYNVNAAALRATFVDYIKKHVPQIILLSGCFLKNKLLTVPQYAATMAVPGEKADELAIQILARMLGVHIAIIERGGVWTTQTKLDLKQCKFVFAFCGHLNLVGTQPLAAPPAPDPPAQVAPDPPAQVAPDPPAQVAPAQVAPDPPAPVRPGKQLRSGKVLASEPSAKKKKTLTFKVKTHGIPRRRSSRRRKRTFSCGQCDSKFNTQSELTDHIAESHKRRFPCSKCLKTYATEGGRAKHEKKHDAQLGCDKCDKKFVYHSELKSHMITHVDERPHTCPSRDCTRKFKTLAELNTHRQKHEGQQWPCPEEGCTYVGSCRKNLSTHMDKHRGVLCPGCPEIYDHRQKLKQHRINTGH